MRHRHQRGIHRVSKAVLADMTFVDNNLRAVALAEHNARSNGLENFSASATLGAEELPKESFDCVLANPPYFAFESDRVDVHRNGPRRPARERSALSGHKESGANGATGIRIERRGYAVIRCVK
jgi:methylase of polypeptide subunit release factors